MAAVSFDRAGASIPVVFKRPWHRGLLNSRRRRTRLLMLIGSVPSPPLTGALLRWRAAIRFLGERYALTVVTFSTPSQYSDCEALLRDCEAVHAVPYRQPGEAPQPALPALVALRESAAMRRTLGNLAGRDFDAVLIEQIFLAHYRDILPMPAILGEHNIESSLLGQAATGGWPLELPAGIADAGVEAAALRAFEDRHWPQFPIRTAVSEAERREIQRRANQGTTLLVENGVEASVWRADIRQTADTLLFAGALGYYPNIDAVHHFCRDVWPELRRRRPALRLIIAGRAPAESIARLDGYDGVSVVADPPDMGAVAARASVAIVPLRLGAGTRLKILEAMAWGLPVVSTTRGAEGLGVADGEHLLLRDGPEAFADGVEALLGNDPLWARLRENGRRLIETRYTWDRVLLPLEAAVEAAVRLGRG